MMQPEFLRPTWSCFDLSNLDQIMMENPGLDTQEPYLGTFEWSSISSPMMSSPGNDSSCSETPSSTFFPTTFPMEFDQFPVFDDPFQVLPYPMEDLSSEIDGFCSDFDTIYGSQIQETVDWSPFPLIAKEISTSPSPTIIQSQETPLVLPSEDMEIDTQISLKHLLQAYGEGIENGQGELMEVISRCVTEKANPLGETMERLAFKLFPQPHQQQTNFINHEAMKDMETAFKAFYEISPYGRFAHFTANSAIIESAPCDAETLHIVDFDMGEGIQWPAMIESMKLLNKTLKITSIKCEDEDEEGDANNCSSPLRWSFDETRRRLYEYAKVCGVKLVVQQMRMQDLVNEVRRNTKTGNNRAKEYMVFNCMVGLPHMGRLRSRKLVNEFLGIANDVITRHSKGIITLGDAQPCEKLRCFEFGEFFQGYLKYFNAVVESIELDFPGELAEARAALESLFVSPFISSHDCVRRWEETRAGLDVSGGIEMNGWRISRENFNEACEIVEGKSCYKVKIGDCENEIMLEWKDVPLVRFSAWGR